jgi:hypothetical protein
MVYSKISLIVGFLVDKKQATEILDIDADDYIVNQTLDKYDSYKISIYNFPCCSESNQKNFIIGTSVKTWVRKCSECSECNEYGCCDNCIGQTCNGYYPVNDILNNPTECPTENVCMYCWKDNKKKIDGACEDCGHKPNWNMSLSGNNQINFKINV